MAKKQSSGRGGEMTSDLPEAIDFHYIKGADFRSIHIDGAIGGLTQKGFLHMALFAERAAIPQRITYKLLPDGTLGDEIKEQREGKKGVVRQMEIDVIVSETTARDLRNWLDDKLSEFEEIRKQIQERNEDKTNNI